eukprot:1160593-Pelagomonas_calceolata.AAC.1
MTHLQLIQGQLPREVDVDHLEAALRGGLAKGDGQVGKVAAGLLEAAQCEKAYRTSGSSAVFHGKYGSMAWGLVKGARWLEGKGCEEGVAKGGLQRKDCKKKGCMKKGCMKKGWRGKWAWRGEGRCK